MAVLLMEGWDHFTTIAAKSWATSIYGGVQTGRNGQGGYTGASWSAGNNGNISKGFTASGEVIVGFAFNYGDLGQTPYWQLREGATVHLEVTRNTGTGLLEFRRGSGGTVLATGVTAIAASTWYHVQVRIKIHDTTGTLAVKVNDVQEITPLTGQDTRNGGASGVVDTILFGSNQITFSTGLHTWTVDDLYIFDTTGGANNDFGGDCKIETLYPNGNGNSSVLVGSDADSTNNYLLVDETPPNDDTDYVESSTVGDKDTYAFTNPTTVSADVKAVQVCPYVKKNDAGSRSIVSVARLSTTEVDSAVKTLPGAYAYLPDIRETKPGGGAWTLTDVSNAEFGIKINA